MPSDTRTPSEAVFRTLRVAFNCDLMSSGPKVIPLGILTMLQYRDRHMVGVMARRSISEADAQHIGRLARQALGKPFDLLRIEQDAIIEAPDKLAAFEGLPNAQSSVEYQSQPLERQSLPWWVDAKPDSGEVYQFLKDELFSVLRRHYWRFAGSDAEDISIKHDHRVVGDLRELELAD